MKRTVTGIHALAMATLVLAVACGGGGGGGNTPPTSPSPPAGGGQSGATITIGANGAVAPAQVIIDAGQTVTFTNSSNRTRNISSDPHPVHTDCAQVNSVNLLSAGQTKVTGAFTTSRTCGFHDHDDPDNDALKGTIVIR